MRILIIMDPGILIPVTGYGGHERLVEMFAKEYQALGHIVELLVTDGSFVQGAKMHGLGPAGFPPKASVNSMAIIKAWKFLRANHQRFDIIHNFGRLIYLLPIANKKVKKIMTYGREITERNARILLSFPHKNIVFTGCSVALISRAGPPGQWKAVYNAIAFEKYQLQKESKSNAPLMFLGRIEQIKGCHIAIAVAKATGNKLIIAGNISALPEEIAYFKTEIEPYIDGDQIQYVGQVNDVQKNVLLGQSKALLMPIEWEEPFGIVMIEAMACGTPVIAFNRGSVEEVVEENITGFKVQTAAQMIDAVEKISIIDRQTCRQRAEERFNVHSIAKNYLDLFAAPLQGKKIVLVTSNQPATNPRIVKEADTLAKNGYDVTVLYTYKIDWASEAEKKMLPAAAWDAILVGGSPHAQRLKFYGSKLLLRFYSFLNELGWQQNQIAEKVQNRCFKQQLRLAKDLNADMYIGHNLGAIAVVVKAAKAAGAQAGFDYEDYHRDEYRVDDTRRRNRIKFLENKYVPHLDFVTFASPLIKEELYKDFPGLQHKGEVILNCFPLPLYYNKAVPVGDKLQLLWFSQTVGPNRGLECLLAALIKINEPHISLTLVGRLREDVAADYKNLASQIPGKVTFSGIVHPDKLNALAAEHDVGLALEPGFSRNNTLALSNKIFTYLLAGNAIIFSETEAQKKFNDEYGAGLSFMPDDVEGLARCIVAYKNSEMLARQKLHNLKLAKSKFNWEIEDQKLLEIVNINAANGK